jgi:hypothetical protein
MQCLAPILIKTYLTTPSEAQAICADLKAVWKDVVVA